MAAKAFFEKTGRLFYGGNEGQVKELLFQDFSKSMRQIVMSEPRKLLSKNHEPDGWITKILPFFGPDKFQISALEID